MLNWIELKIDWSYEIQLNMYFLILSESPPLTYFQTTILNTYFVLLYELVCSVMLHTIRGWVELSFSAFLAANHPRRQFYCHRTTIPLIHFQNKTQNFTVEIVMNIKHPIEQNISRNTPTCQLIAHSTIDYPNTWIFRSSTRGPETLDTRGSTVYQM